MKMVSELVHRHPPTVGWRDNLQKFRDTSLSCKSALTKSVNEQPLYGPDAINGMPNRQHFKQCVLGFLSSPVSGNLQRQFQNTRMTYVAHLGGNFVFFVFEFTHILKVPNTLLQWWV